MPLAPPVSYRQLLSSASATAQWLAAHHRSLELEHAGLSVAASRSSTPEELAAAMTGSAAGS